MRSWTQRLSILHARRLHFVCPMNLSIHSRSATKRAQGQEAEGRRGHVKTKTSGHPKSYGCDLRHSMPYRVSNRLPRVLEDSGAPHALLRDFYAQSHCGNGNGRLISMISSPTIDRWAKFGSILVQIHYSSSGIIRHPTRAFTRQFGGGVSYRERREVGEEEEGVALRYQKGLWFEKVHSPNRCKPSLHALLESRSYGDDQFSPNFAQPPRWPGRPDAFKRGHGLVFTLRYF